ncbi:MAG: pilus (MSHA type) biogenesis protein MshL [Oleiphilaceae bacterium]|nr:pilus (MSHA type) biogenesis protein MshL [Oleiphilaceae bacterium]
MTARSLQIALGFFALVTLSACSSNPLLQTSSASSTETAEDIEEALARAGAEADTGAGSRTPEDISAALMPDMKEPSGPGQEEERFNVTARELPARPFFQSLVDGSGYNVVVHPDVESAISMELQQVTVPEVMEMAGDLYNLDIERQGRLYRIRPGGLRTRVFQLDYLHMQRIGGSETQVRSGQVSGARDSEDGEGGLVGTRISTESRSDFWGDLRESLTMMVGTDDGRKVITTPGAGMIVVRAEPQALRDVEEYLRRLQLISQRQVILEARIMEVELNESYQQGVDWNYIDQISSSGPSSAINAGVSSGNVSNPRGSGGVFSTALQIGDFNTLIRLLGQQGNVQMLSSPRISTVNNEKAVIKVGSDEFFVTDIDFRDTGTAVAGGQDRRSTSVDLTPFFSGISLDVTPQISEDGLITLHVHPSVSEVQDQEKLITIGDEQVTLPLALSTVRETDSIINARSGQIVVIGGLIQSSSEEVTTAVPFFSKIPVLGELFKQRRFESRKSELVILLRPVISGEDVWREDAGRSRERVRALRELMESSESVTPQPAQPR